MNDLYHPLNVAFLDALHRIFRLKDDHNRDAATCSCSRLIGILSHGEKLPDHVCFLNLKLSCASWIRENWIIGPPVVLPLGDGRWTNLEHPSDWPIPIIDSSNRILLAIRQWIEDPPDQKLGELLQSLPEWELAIHRFNKLVSPDTQDLTKLRNILSACGLPATPGSAEYLLSHARPDDSEKNPLGPTRGVLVTTLAISPLPHSEGLGEVITQQTSVSPWVTEELKREASKVAAAHTRWWQSFMSQVNLVDLRRLNKRKADDLTVLVDSFIKGDIDRLTLEARAFLQERELIGEPLSPQQKKEVRRRIQERIRRKK